MSSYSRNNGSNYSRNAPSSSDRQRGSGYGGERYIPRDGDDRRDDRRDDLHEHRGGLPHDGGNHGHVRLQRRNHASRNWVRLLLSTGFSAQAFLFIY